MLTGIEGMKKFGFGLMRLPKLEDGSMDIEQIKKMVDMFLENGYTYFDTAWAYAGSEAAIKEALVDRYPRESFKLATKLAAWKGMKTKEEAQFQFQNSLNLTGAGYFDFYLLHNLGGSKTQIFDDYDIWNFLADKKAQGLIKNLGFSYHADAKELDEILTKHPEMDFVQLQINYADWENPQTQARKLYETVVKHGKKVIVMEPVKGGLLADPPKSVKEVFDAAGEDCSYPSWAIRFAANLPEVLVVLSGMSNIAQMEDNLKTMNAFNGLSDKESEVIKAASDAINAVDYIQCTFCSYCRGVCPSNIGIPNIFQGMNHVYQFEDHAGGKQKVWFMKNGMGLNGAESCLECGACEGVCPQRLPIRDLLKKSIEMFGEV